MSFSIYCNHCNSELDADENLIGQKLNCPVCNQLVPIQRPVKESLGRIVENVYPAWCVFAGVLLLLISVVNFIMSYLLHSRALHLAMSGVRTIDLIIGSVIMGIIYLISGILFLVKNKFGPLIAIVVLGLAAIGFYMRLTSGEIKIGNLQFFLLAIDFVIFFAVALSIYAFHEWQKNSNKESSLIVKCPECHTSLKTTESKINRKISCLKCAEPFICRS